MNISFQKHVVLASVVLFAFSSMVTAQDRMALPTSKRAVAITIDDLPVASTVQLDDAGYLNLTHDLVNNITTLGIPAYGFVIAGKLSSQGADKLNIWLDAGLELGNHSFSHTSLNNVGPDRFIESIVAGEQGVKNLLSARNMEMRYFRYPMLHRGTDTESVDSVTKFLLQSGYTTAPVSIDNQEWVFSRAYDQANAKNDTEMMKKIGDAYVAYMESVFEFFETNSVDLLGYEPKQILLIHANALNASYLDELAQMLESRHYNFITLDEAMTDPFYSMPQNYLGGRGLSWLHRVAFSQGKELRSEPRDPQWLSNIYP